jgi:hypothetical protein
MNYHIRKHGPHAWQVYAVDRRGVRLTCQVYGTRREAREAVSYAKSAWG